MYASCSESAVWIIFVGVTLTALAEYRGPHVVYRIRIIAGNMSLKESLFEDVLLRDTTEPSSVWEGGEVDSLTEPPDSLYHASMSNQCRKGL